MKSGEAFGEISLSEKIRRTATVVTAENCHFLTITKNEFTIFIKSLTDN